MSSRLNPYINFPGTTREAMAFYQDVFGGTLTSSTFGEFGNTDAELADKIMHAMLVTDGGYALMASDVPPGMEYRPGTDVTVSLSGDDAADLRGYWEKLSAGGTVTMALEKQAWGDEYGACIDKFGTSWMVNITPASA